MPVFLLALPGGALADIVDRRVFLLGTQIWTILAASLLATADHPAPDDRRLAAGADLRDRHRLRADRPGLERDRPRTGPARGHGAGDRAERHRLQPDAGDRPGDRRVPDPAGRLQPGVLDVCDVDPGGDQRAVRLAAGAPFHRPAARAFRVRDAGRHALCPQHLRDPGGDGAHGVLFDPRLGAVGAAAAVCAARPGCWVRACMA